MTNLGNLDKIRHDQMAFSKAPLAPSMGQDQTRSGFPKFVTENGWLMLDFPKRIWEAVFATYCDTHALLLGEGGKALPHIVPRYLRGFKEG